VSIERACSSLRPLFGPASAAKHTQAKGARAETKLLVRQLVGGPKVTSRAALE